MLSSKYPPSPPQCGMNNIDATITTIPPKAINIRFFISISPLDFIFIKECVFVAYYAYYDSLIFLEIPGFPLL